MKKRTARAALKTVKIKKKSNSIRRKTKLKGRLGAGTLYAVVGLLIVMLGAVSMIGNIVPLSNKSPLSGQPVIISPPKIETQKDNLQLFTFPGITYTPTPLPTTPPGPGSRWDDDNKSGGGGGGGKPGSCFIAGTKILMADFTNKNIEDIRPGDKIMSYDGEGFSKQTVKHIEDPVRDHHYIVKLADGTEIGITDDHALYTNEGWQAISPENAKNESPGLAVTKLEIGDKLLNSKGKYITVLSMKYLSGDVQTYNLKDVSRYNNYYANGIVAHNKGGGGGGGGGGSSGGTAM